MARAGRRVTELTHQLTPQLKRLRLSGVLESLELRNQQAIQDKLSYVEFLARLIQDEVERRAALAACLPRSHGQGGEA